MKQQIAPFRVINDNWYERLMKFSTHAIGLIIVAWLVVMATNYRFTALKNSAADQSWEKAYTTSAQRLKQLNCLTKNIYWEAGTEPFEGKVAVAQVTMNRLESGKFADTLCGVVYQKNVFYTKVICQFSWFCEDTHRTRPVSKPHWDESEIVARKVLLEGFRLPSLKTALYFHADYVKPNWNKPKIEKIGRHIFYGEKT